MDAESATVATTCLCDITVLEVELAEAVPCAVVVIEVSGFRIDLFLLCFVIGEGSGIEQLLYAQLSRIVLRQRHDLVIALTDEVGRQDETAATESRKDLVCDSAIDRTEVLDLCLTLLGIAVHREHAQYEVFVLHVAVLHCFA